MSTHAARIESSDRLQRVAAYLSDHEWRSTMDIIQACNVCAINSIIFELRRNGYVIETRRMTTPEGEPFWQYRLCNTQGQYEMSTIKEAV